MKEYTVAVVGATGAVGQKMIQLLEHTEIPLKKVKLLASKRSAGKTVSFKGTDVTIEETTDQSFEGVDIALFSAGGSITTRFEQAARQSGAVVIDNTSAFRMDPETPLVVPEVNPEALANHKQLIANPNCSTTQMVVALKPIHEAYGLDRVIVSTYQAVSGAGVEAIEELDQQNASLLKGEKPQAAILPSSGDKNHYQIAYNVIPQIDLFAEEGYTFEEWKMINETKKIMGLPDLKVSATCVRVPVKYGHSESVYIEIDRDDITVADLQALLAQADGVIVQDDPANQLYPLATESEDKKETFVGRIRKDPDVANGFHLWIVSDNLIKGAAWNSLQIAETMVKMKLI